MGTKQVEEETLQFEPWISRRYIPVSGLSDTGIIPEKVQLLDVRKDIKIPSVEQAFKEFRRRQLELELLIMPEDVGMQLSGWLMGFQVVQSDT